eukprot:scaffold20851_cov183-Isochrysis_galbana.AAC.1
MPHLRAPRGGLQEFVFPPPPLQPLYNPKKGPAFGLFPSLSTPPRQIGGGSRACTPHPYGRSLGGLGCGTAPARKRKMPARVTVAAEPRANASIRIEIG